ncbi:YHS domain protein [Leptospira harrisiae]|uniref:YHS domain protein n=2 Tax=Leptospira harrisiae TaxID=2023189 RepID=A0A2N0AMS8_9LEPT|nr:YHS domain protein [Leptospira harrisiae]PKA09113.1 YHS domain protein [Leptospira harrisiae]
MNLFVKLLALLWISFPIMAKDINTSFIGNLAVDGYDVVAYFKEGKPVKGNSNFQYTWQNAVWRFSTAENLNQFKQTPEKFAPKYGGYCAYAMSEGEKYDISPEVWNITEGKLYLNYDREVHDKWIKKKNELINKADGFWRKNEK